MGGEFPEKTSDGLPVVGASVPAEYNCEHWIPGKNRTDNGYRLKLKERVEIIYCENPHLADYILKGRNPRNITDPARFSEDDLRIIEGATMVYDNLRNQLISEGVEDFLRKI